jgi:hypothetical protein
VSLENFSQGGAFVHNLVCGTVWREPVLDRPTPYHLPHSTQVAGYAAIEGGDDRYVGNVFLGGDVAEAYAPTAGTGKTARHGTAGYAGHPTTLAGYLAEVHDLWRGDHERFKGVRQPVYLRDNVFAAGAEPVAGEVGAVVLDDEVHVAVVEDGEGCYLETRLPAGFDDARIGLVTGDDLERVRFVDADFEERDGSPAVLGTDLVGETKHAGSTYPAGPLASLSSGTSRTRVW